MFSFFKKQYHEPENLQHQDLLNEPIGSLALSGEDCDQLKNAHGAFGRCYDNPIPVNGLLGTYKYLGKIISPGGNFVFFHRIGSLISEICPNPVDTYEIVDMEGAYWDLLFIDMYHPRRSNKVPEGFRLKPFDKVFGDIPFAFGVDIFCRNFPYDLPEAIESRNNLSAFARRVKERVSQGGYNRPKTQEIKISNIMSCIVSIQN